MNILEIHHEIVTQAEGLENCTKQAIAKLHEAQNLNAGMQKKHAAGTPDWHMHETIDDRIHEALSLLGD